MLTLVNLGLAMLLTLSIGGCNSKLISAPGITGRFIEKQSRKPLSGIKVRYTHIGGRLQKETTTNATGRFSFEPEFTYGYAGYPTSPVMLQVVLEVVRERDRLPLSFGNFEVKQTDIDNALIDAGDIQVDRKLLEFKLRKPIQSAR
jgi:hypothetical protein